MSGIERGVQLEGEGLARPMRHSLAHVQRDCCNLARQSVPEPLFRAPILEVGLHKYELRYMDSMVACA